MKIIYQRINRSERRIWLAALAVRLLMFGLLLWSFGGHGLIALGDSNQYLRLAKGFLSTGTLVDPDFPGLIEGTRPPGYPIYLAAFMYLGIPLWVASLIQLGAASGIPIFIMKIGGLLGFEKKPIAIAGWFTAMEPLEVLYSVTLLSDAFGALFFIAGTYWLIRFWRTRVWKNLILAALILGAMNYVRPIALFLYILIPAFILAAGFLLERWRWRQHLKAAVVFGAVFYLVLTPWLARNYYDFGHWDFLSAASRHLYDYSAAAVRAAAEGTSFEEMRQVMRKEIMPLLPEPRDIRQFANQEILKSKAIEIIRRHPKEYAKLYFFSLQTFFISGNYHYLAAFYDLIDGPSRGDQSFTVLLSSRSVADGWKAVKTFISEPYGLIALFGRILWGLVFVFSLLGAWVAYRRHPESRFGALLYIFFLFYLALITLHLVTGMEARHRLFLNPLYFLFMSLTLTWIFSKSKQAARPESEAR